MAMTAVTILDTDIRRDAQGRFCLNDLHRAAGGSMTTPAIAAKARQMLGVKPHGNGPLNADRAGSG